MKKREKEPILLTGHNIFMPVNDRTNEQQQSEESKIVHDTFAVEIRRSDTRQIEINELRVQN